MSERYPSEWVEAVARGCAAFAYNGAIGYRKTREEYIEEAWPSFVIQAPDILAEIDASRIVWVAPWEPTRKMIEAAWRANPADDEPNDAIASVVGEYREMRDACLAERRGEGR